MPRSNTAQARAILKVFVGIGVIGVLVGLGLFINSIQFTQRADLVVARVVENPSHRSTSGGSSATLYRPIFGFTDAEGREVTAQVRMASDRFNYRVNSEVEIYHVRGSNPPRIRIASFSGLWFAPSIVLVIGVGFMGIGVFALRSMREPKPNEGDGLQAPTRSDRT